MEEPELYINTPKNHLYNSMPKFKKSRFWNRLATSITENNHEAIGIWGSKGLGKSTLSRTIAARIYGSHEVAREFRITRKDELPKLIEKVQHDPRFWIDYNGITLKRIWLLDWDDIAVDLPSSQTGATDEYVKWHKYFMTIRSHVGVVLGSFPDWSDFKRRMKVSFTGEISLQWVTRRLPNGNIVKKRKGEMLWFRNQPDYRKKYQNLEGKEMSIPIVWSNLPKKILQQEIDSRTYLADKLLSSVRDSVKGKARIMAGLSGPPESHMLEWQKELLTVIHESAKNKPMKITNTNRINDKYQQLYKMRIPAVELRKYMTRLDGQELITYRHGEGKRGEVQVTDLGKEIMRLLQGKAEDNKTD